MGIQCFLFWGIFPILILGIWDIFFKIANGIWDTGTPFQGLTDTIGYLAIFVAFLCIYRSKCIVSSDSSIHDDRCSHLLDQSNGNTHSLHYIYITQQRWLYIRLYPSQQSNKNYGTCTQNAFKDRCKCFASTK